MELQSSGNLIARNNVADLAEFEETLARIPGARDKVEVHKGWFEETLPGTSVQNGISVLRMDGDWCASTMTILDNLFDQVVDGGVILIDDYYYWEGCAKAVHDYLSKTRSPLRVRQSPCGLAYIEKQ